MINNRKYSVDRKPYLIDALDSELIALLREDARLSVSALSKALKVSRGTVQARLDRLLETGAILGFTIRAHERLEQDVVKAVMLIEVVGKSTSQVIQRLRGIPELVKLHTTNGNWDLMAEIEASNLAEFDRVLGTVRMIDGVLNSETSILLTSV